jgi:hypothetical protein
MDDSEPTVVSSAIVERRELRFSPATLQAMIGWSLGAGSSQRLPPIPPDGIRLVPEDSRIDLAYGQGPAARLIPLPVEQLATLLIAYCIRALIPLPRVARKEVRIGARYVALVFHVEHRQAPTPEIVESSVVRNGPVRQWR